MSKVMARNGRRSTNDRPQDSMHRPFESIAAITAACLPAATRSEREQCAKQRAFIAPAVGSKARSEATKLHLGCGPRYIPGFVHVDAQPAPHVDIVGPVERLPVEDDSVSLIYASHVLEHFGRYAYKAVLKEWFRVLQPGGILRLSVPDFSVCAALYYENGLVDGLSGLVGLIVGGQRNSHDYHKMIFDEQFLRHDLLDTGFREVRRWDWRATEHADIDDYSQAYIPHLHKEDGRHMSLNLEGVK